MQYFGFDRPSFGIKTYGFGESAPKLQADFTTGTYKANGAAKTFADLFTFNRAGKAWLVKDTGLQEYAADVPRFDDGLLIEQSATNLLTNTNPTSFASPNTKITSSADGTVSTQYKVESLDAGRYSYTTEVSRGADTVSSVYLKRTVTDTLVSISGYNSGRDTESSTINTRTGVITKAAPSFVFKNTKVIAVGADWFYVESLRVGGVYRYIWVGSPEGVDATQAGEHFYTALPQFLNVGANPIDGRSPILTNGVATTRPADFLLNKITGTTVTGDWDSTLNLSIVNGQLVHSGYGRIRSLEIN